VLFIWLGFNLYNEITHQENKAKAWQDIKNAFIGEKSWEIYLASILMLANWGIEAFKWQLLISPLQKVSFQTAFKAIFAGTSFAANTPNRVGEYFGRMIYIEEGKRLQSVALTVAGSFSQVLVTLICGTIGLFFYSNISARVDTPTISSFWLNIAGIGALLVSIICTMLYFKMSWLVAALTKIPFIGRYEFFFQKINELSNDVLLKALLLSLLRYWVFIAQYVLVLHAFGVEGSMGTFIVLITVLFLVLTIVPSFVIIEAGIRSTVSIEIFRVITSNTAAIFATSTFIWLLNLMLPALIGVLLLLGKRVFKR
jgi:Lysylphosphatidylglycerol synthase TM region